MREPFDTAEPGEPTRPIGRMALLVVVVLVIEILVLGLLTRGCA